MTVRPYKSPAAAQGHPHKGSLAISCRFDPETFEAIREADLPDCTSFAAKVRLLVEWGLETYFEGEMT